MREVLERRDDLPGDHQVPHPGRVLKRVQVAPLKPNLLRRSVASTRWLKGSGCRPSRLDRHPVSLRPCIWSPCTVRSGERAALELGAQCRSFWRWQGGLRVSGKPLAPRPRARQRASPRRFPRPVGDGDRQILAIWQEVAQTRLLARALLSRCTRGAAQICRRGLLALIFLRQPDSQRQRESTRARCFFRVVFRLCVSCLVAVLWL